MASEDERKVKIEFCNMPLDLKMKAIDFVKNKYAQSSKHTVPDVTLARELKSHFDEFFHATWQCIVGKNFGSEIGYESGFMIYFYIGATAILLWRCG